VEEAHMKRYEETKKNRLHNSTRIVRWLIATVHEESIHELLRRFPFTGKHQCNKRERNCGIGCTLGIFAMANRGLGEASELSGAGHRTRE
jgi:hypothetical protein